MSLCNILAWILDPGCIVIIEYHEDVSRKLLDWMQLTITEQTAIMPNAYNSWFSTNNEFSIHRKCVISRLNRVHTM